jgi:putative hydrolase of the HAD superfamily
MANAIRRHGDTPEIEAVIFDYGEVLAHRPSLGEFARMAALFGMDAQPFSKLWDRSRPAYDRGELTAEAYWLQFARDNGAEIGKNQIEQLRQWEVAMWSNLDTAMVAWSRRLNDTAIKTAILSNMHPDLVAKVKTFDWVQKFTVQTLSAEVGLVKPEPAIFEHTLGALGTVGARTLFVDDREVNIEAARLVGIRAIRFRSVAQLRADLQSLEFPILPLES